MRTPLRSQRDPIRDRVRKILVERKFRPAGFAAPLGLKDMRLTSQAAETLRVPTPVLGVLRDHLMQTIAQHGEDMNWSGIGMAIDANAGL